MFEFQDCSNQIMLLDAHFFFKKKAVQTPIIPAPITATLLITYDTIALIV